MKLSNKLSLTVLLTAFLLTWSSVFAEKEITIVQGAGPRDLDPHVDETVAVMDIYRHIFEPLVQLSADGEVLPGLAKSWEWIEENKIRFYLQEGVHFHNGDEFTADTVAFNVQRIWDPEVASTKTVRLESLKTVEIIDKYTIDLVTDDSFPLLLTYLPILLMMSEHHTGDNSLDYVKQNPIGTGQFKFESWRPDQFVSLVKNNEYWGEPTNIDRLTFRIVPEAATRLAALLSGEADLVANIPPLLAPQVERSPNHLLVEGNMGLGLLLHLNTLNQGPIQNSKVRQALNYAVDLEAIINGVLGGYANPLKGQLADETTFGFNPSLNPYEYDIELATTLLEEAGYADGFTITLHTPQGRYPNDRETAEAIAGMWNEVGINTTVVVREWGTFLEELKGKEEAPGAWLIGWYWTPTFDASTTAAWFTTNGVYNIWDTPQEYDDWVRIANTSIVPDEREHALQQAMRILNEEAGAVFLHQPTKLYGVSTRLLNWEPRPDDALFLHYVDVKE